MSVKSLSSVRKACRILSALVDPAVVRLTDIARVTGLDMTTCSRILSDLQKEGFVEREPQNKHYSFSNQAYLMHHAAFRRFCPVTAARPALIRLAKEFMDTVILSVPQGWQSICADLCFGDYPIRANYLSVGSHRPLGVGAGSLALLSAMPAHEIEAVLPFVQEGLKRYPDYSMELLRSKIIEGQQKGYSILLDVVVNKMGGIAMSIMGPQGTPLAAISIAALNERITQREEELVLALRKEVQQIEQNWATISES